MGLEVDAENLEAYQAVKISDIQLEVDKRGTYDKNTIFI